MAYVPPHKRNSNNPIKPTPVPESIEPRFKKQMKLKTPKHHTNMGYVKDTVSIWFPVGLDDLNNNDFSSLRLQPVESIMNMKDGKPQVLVKSLINTENDEAACQLISENVHGSLLSVFRIFKNEPRPDIKPQLVVRVGKILFHGSRKTSLACIEDASWETDIRKLNRTFYTTLPAEYIDTVFKEADSNTDFVFKKAKDIFNVQVSDKARPGITLSCKCRIREDKKLSLHKVETGRTRHMQIDISCVGKGVDVRLMLWSRKIISDLTAADLAGVRKMIDTASVDPTVKGGINWKESSSSGRYYISSVWHSITSSYSTPSLLLKIRDVDRVDIQTGISEPAREVNFKLNGLKMKLQEGNVDESSVSGILKDNLSLIWNHFLCCEQIFA